MMDRMQGIGNIPERTMHARKMWMWIRKGGKAEGITMKTALHLKSDSWNSREIMKHLCQRDGLIHETVLNMECTVNAPGSTTMNPTVTFTRVRQVLLQGL